jgi:pimeloyl-ACP methyl ester carboxylesterase
MIHHKYASLSAVRMHYLEAGEGNLVLLLHGWPHTSHAWRHIIPELSRHVRVVAPDLRGLGDTSRPLSGFDNKTVAGDILELIDSLGIETFSVVGHDWGGPVAFALCLLARSRIPKLALVDSVLAGDGRPAGGSQGGTRWHHLFHRTPNLPEILTAGREAAYLSWFYEEYSERPGSVDPSDIAEYVRTYSQPGAMRCGFEYYRTAEASSAFVQQVVKAEGKLKIPVLSVAGDSGRARADEAKESIEILVEKLDHHLIPGCGHLVPEEAPEELLGYLIPFLSQ